MKSRDKASHLAAADVLAVLSQNAIRRGDTALGCTRLIECLSLLQSGSERSGAAALDAAAELAAAAGQPDRAVEFYTASERVLRRSRVPEGPRASEIRKSALERLRKVLGSERYETSRKTAKATPFPFEFYVSAALHWLEGLEATHIPRAKRVSDGATNAHNLEHPGSTAVLITQVQNGNPTARERLAGRYLEVLRHYAHGRLPDRARDLMDTDDLVQVTVVRALEKIEAVKLRKRGDFLAYIRKILINKVRDEFRRSSKLPARSELSESIPSAAPSPLEETLEQEWLAAYYKALSRLSTRQRGALTLRIEHGFTYQQVADEIGCSSANAARMVVSRSLVSVAKALRKY